MAIEIGLFRNCPLCIGAWDSGTVGSLEVCIFGIIAPNQKNRLNLLTNFLRSFQIHKGPTSDTNVMLVYITIIWPMPTSEQN
jgi:hypothetical protein